MIQRGHRVHLAREAVTEAFGGDFDGDIAPHPRIVCAIHFAHASGAYGRADFVGSKSFAGGERHARDSASLTDAEAEWKWFAGGLPATRRKVGCSAPQQEGWPATRPGAEAPESSLDAFPPRLPDEPSISHDPPVPRSSRRLHDREQLGR